MMHLPSRYDVDASHCSCYGFEGQWMPEEVTKEELLRRAHVVYGAESDDPAILEIISNL